MGPTLKSFLRDESGATAIEYSLIARHLGRHHRGRAGLGTKLVNTFTNVNTALN